MDYTSRKVWVCGILFGGFHSAVDETHNQKNPMAKSVQSWNSCSLGKDTWIAQNSAKNVNIFFFKKESEYNLFFKKSREIILIFLRALHKQVSQTSLQDLFCFSKAKLLSFLQLFYALIKLVFMVKCLYKYVIHFHFLHDFCS